MNKLVYSGLSILELSKIVMYEFWYDYVKAKFGGKTKLCYLETECFSVYIKADDISKDIAKDVEKGLILQIMNYTNHYRKERTKKLLT